MVGVLTDSFVEDTIDLTNLEEEEYRDSDGDDDSEDKCYKTNVIKFDTACSRNMSGTAHRIYHQHKRDNVIIQGFNGSTSSVDAVGINGDGKMEYYVKSMPTNLTLLSAHEYVKDGAAVLFPEDGVVLRLTDSERVSLQKFITQFDVSKQLSVKNRTYEVANKASTGEPVEQAMNNTATRYFNSKVHVSNKEERILSMLLMGFTHKDLYSMATSNCVEGLPRDLTKRALNQFSHRHGTSPDILQLARPNLAGNTKGYMAPKPILTHVGQRVEADFMFTDFNMVVSKRTVKIPTLGGAIAAFLTVDGHSEYVHGLLVHSVANSVEYIRTVHQQYLRDGHTIETFAADGGVIIQSEYRVMLPDAQKYLLKEKIKPEIGEPYNHDNGNELVERIVRAIKELILLAIMYILNNPNFNLIGFTQHEIFQLWGELFNWAIVIWNLKICPNNTSVTKWEVYHKRRPDLRTIRLLPIMSVLYVIRTSKVNSPVPTNKRYWKRGLYVGPSIIIPGSIRVAIKTNKRIKIITTSKFKGVSDGGALQIYSQMDKLNIKDLEGNPTSDEEQLDLQHSANQPVRHDTNDAGDHINTAEPSSSDHHNVAVAAILQHKGKAQKKSSMKFKVQWKGFDDTHDSWLPWSELQHNSVLHAYLRSKHLGHIIPLDHQSAEQHENDKDSDSDDVALTPPESRGDQKQVVEKDAQVVHTAQRDQINMQQQVKQWLSREERMKAREERKIIVEGAHSVSELLTQLKEKGKDNSITRNEQCYFTDWSNHTEKSLYYSFTEDAYVIIDSDCESPDIRAEEGYKAVAGPRKFEMALSDKDWGDAARTELETVTTATRTIVEVDRDTALEHIRNGAQLLRLIPIYEEKIREGVVVRKVRLVADGRQHHIHGPTYTATPNREECMILFHIFAHKDWDYYTMDEKRAFLSAQRQDTRKMYVTIPGSSKMYAVYNALYGTKDAMRDYRIKVEDMYINKLDCQKLQLCSCIYIKRILEDIILMLGHVDDYLYGGSNNVVTERFITEARTHAQYTEPEKNASKFLGMEIERDRSRRIILIRLTGKIEELNTKYPHATRKVRNVPMPVNGYLVRDYELDGLSETKKRLLNKEEITTYMAIVGCLIWIQGIRLDIIFAVLYLSWFTKSPRQHHMDMAEYTVGYLHTTKDMPLVLGGEDDIEPIVDADASHGTGPNSRSISGELTRLNEKSGAISAKSKAQTSVKLSSFESELDNTTTNIKTANRVSNILKEITIDSKPARIRQDNEAMINFVKGNSGVRGARHMELRMYYTREEYQKGRINIEHRSGKILTADKLTKLGNVEEHRKFTADIQGLNLLGYDYYSGINTVAGEDKNDSV